MIRKRASEKKIVVRSPGPPRWADLGGKRILLLGLQPQSGDALKGHFHVPAARKADQPLSPEVLKDGLVILSTLPNITKHACASQILDLEEHVREEFFPARLVHVSSDEVVHWREVDHYHPHLAAPGYSLHEADERSRVAFANAFGVGVQGHRRIAHGLFALLEGVFLLADIPFHQMSSPDVHQFLLRLGRLQQRLAPQMS